MRPFILSVSALVALAAAGAPPARADDAPGADAPGGAGARQQIERRYAAIAEAWRSKSTGLFLYHLLPEYTLTYPAGGRWTRRDLEAELNRRRLRSGDALGPFTSSVRILNIELRGGGREAVVTVERTGGWVRFDPGAKPAGRVSAMTVRDTWRDLGGREGWKLASGVVEKAVTTPYPGPPRR